MNTKALLLTFAILTSLPALSQGDNYDKGVFELNRGNFNAALEYLQPLVLEGYAPAQYQVALIYQNGYGVIPKDGMKALELLTLAAEQNYAEAQFDLALLYTDSKVVKQDLKKAFELTHQAAKKDLASAQFNLGVMYANGTGVKRDNFKASYWYKNAANQNYALAQYNLALLYSEGKGVEKSDDLSYIWNTIAAWNGYPNAEKSRKIDARGMSQRKIEENTNKATTLYQKIIKTQNNKAKLAENPNFY